jgi:hypothetical protein
LRNRIEHGYSNQIGFSFSQSKEMVPGFSWLIGYVVDKRLFQNLFGRMVKQLCERLKDRQVRGTLQIEDPARLLRLIILVKANRTERLEHLVATIVNAMRLADERDYNIPISGFIQEHFRVTRRYHLATLFFRSLGQYLVNLPLPQDFEVGVRFVEQQDGSGVRVEMGKEKQGLLQTSA